MAEEKAAIKEKQDPKAQAKSKSSVKNAKKTLSSTQMYLKIAEIRDDSLVLKNGGIRAVLKVSSINFNLKGKYVYIEEVAIPASPAISRILTLLKGFVEKTLSAASIIRFLRISRSFSLSLFNVSFSAIYFPI